jgi:hypothetical protein
MYGLHRVIVPCMYCNEIIEGPDAETTRQEMLSHYWNWHGLFKWLCLYLVFRFTRG